MKLQSLIFVLLVIFLVSCKENTEIPGCNPEDGRVVNGKHYISGNMLTEDNTWDYLVLQKYHERRARLYPDVSCIPIEPDPVFEETLNSKTEEIDLRGN